MVQLVYDFSEGNKDMGDLLGGKGANLAEMTNLGLPVPPGFTITTDACRDWMRSGRLSDDLITQVREHLSALEETMGRPLGADDDPLLVSVRSGAAVSMPGMMETVLNVGLTDASVQGLAKRTGNERFAWDAYRRLIQMFGSTVLGIEGSVFEDAIEARKAERGVRNDTELDADDWQALVGSFKASVEEHTGEEFPQDPRRQLTMAVGAVFDSWNSKRAILYRRQERIPGEAGTAVNIVAMVFGNLGDDSGTGVAFTRDPSTGEQGIYGDYLSNAQGEDVVAGVRNTVPLAELEQIDKASYDQLLDIMSRLEDHYKDLCDIEFTIEAGKLWMLQTRVGKRTAAAAFRIASNLVDEGVIDLDEALRRVTGAELAMLMFPRFDSEAETTLLSKATGASPGAAVGKVVFTSTEAELAARRGEDVILVRRETNPDDLPGMIAAQGVLTSRGGKTSHAAVVARGMGKTCVCGAEDLKIDVAAGRIETADGTVVNKGDVISIDGNTGEVFAGEVPVAASAVMRYFEGDAKAGSGDDLVDAVDRILGHADEVRRMRVRANADNGEDSARARRFGAEGTGLCRTEHMFLGERRQAVERLILATTETERDAALAALEPLQRGDFVEIFSAMDGLPVTVRLIDPPLHEFLPPIEELAVKVAVAEERGETGDEADHDRVLLAHVQRLHEENPMLGLRGVRLGLVIPGLIRMQVRAVAEAAAELKKQGKDPRPEIMVPLVAAVQELEMVGDEIEAVVAEVSKNTGVELSFPLGTMIELPRAAMTGELIAERAEFFSFGTNDLTQTTWGFSRDDVEGSFFGTYIDRGVFGVSPFETIDRVGVGGLIKAAVRDGRTTRPDLHLGICGEHGGDPDSIHFFDEVGLDYVSCSPFRVPVARLEAGRATLGA